MHGAVLVPRMRRRTLLASVAAATASLGGCLTGSDPGTPADDGTPTDSPAGSPDDSDTPRATDCPTSQNLDVEWPAELDEDTVVDFVEAYEAAYYREVVVDFERESRLDRYELGGSVSEGPTRSGEGWVLTYRGGGGVYTPTLLLSVTPEEAPDGVDPVALSAVETDRVSDLLVAAAENGEAEDHVTQTGEPVERLLERFEALDDSFELTGPGDEDTLYVDLDGTTVALTVQASNFHGDYGWTARYYVDEHVVRRVEARSDAAPQDGDLLECRESA